MSVPPLSDHVGGEEQPQRSQEAILEMIVGPVRAIGFWSAVSLPFLYVPLLATGLDTVAQTAVFLVLLLLNVLAVVVGHSYSPST